MTTVHPTHHRFQDLTGHVFGKLTVLNYVGRSKNKKSLWLCQCACGKTTEPIQATHLQSGATVSCGCVRDAKFRKIITRHGLRSRPEYRIWMAMKMRCENARQKHYQNYGGRGIRLCARWRNSFPNFFADMGPRPSTRHSIERIDHDGDYEPENCKWAEQLEQARNKRSNHLVLCQSEMRTLADWSEVSGVKASTIRRRLRLGWTAKESIFTRPIARSTD